jgi:hypothetical protein
MAGTHRGVRVARGAAVDRGDLPACAATHRGARKRPSTVDAAHTVTIGLRLILNYTINFERGDPRACARCIAWPHSGSRRPSRRRS